MILAFAHRRADLQRRLPRLKASLDYAGGLWLAWPKRASGVSTDLGDGPVRELGLAAGLVDNKVCAIDDTWSGLRFVYRLRRPALSHDVDRARTRSGALSERAGPARGSASAR